MFDFACFLHFFIVLFAVWVWSKTGSAVSQKTIYPHKCQKTHIKSAVCKSAGTADDQLKWGNVSIKHTYSISLTATVLRMPLIRPNHNTSQLLPQLVHLPRPVCSRPSHLQLCHSQFKNVMLHLKVFTCPSPLCT